MGADGIQEVSNSSWWKSDFMNPLLNDPSCSKLSYALTFANESPDRYWVPLKGNPTWPSFIEFYQSDHSMFAGDARWTASTKKYGFGAWGGAAGPTTDYSPADGQ